MKKTSEPGIKQIDSRKYLLRIVVTDPRTGRKLQRQETFEGTFAEAVARKQEIRSDVRQGKAKKQPTLGAFAAQWLEHRVARFKPATIRAYQQHLVLHILPALGDLRINTIVPSDVDEFVSDQTKKGLAGWTVRSQITLLRQLAKAALRDELTHRDFCLGVVVPTVSQYDEDNPNSLTAKQLAELLEEISTNHSEWFTLVFLLAFTGLRWGEATGLQWSDIDWEEGAIRVRRTNYQGVAQDLKTFSSRRTVAMPPRIAEVLRDHQQDLARSQRRGYESGYLFTTCRGELHKGSTLSHPLKRACKAIKLPFPFSTHGLRRTFNNLARQYASLPVLQSMVGHATDEMSIHYSSVPVAEKQVATSSVLQLVASSGPKKKV